MLCGYGKAGFGVVTTRPGRFEYQIHGPDNEDEHCDHRERHREQHEISSPRDLHGPLRSVSEGLGVGSMIAGTITLRLASCCRYVPGFNGAWRAAGASGRSLRRV